MRKDELEEFIEEHRAEFDQVEAFDSEVLWEQINHSGVQLGLTKVKAIVWSAIVISSLVLATYINSIYNQNQSFETIAGLTEAQESQRDEMIQFVSHKEQKIKEKNIDISTLEDFALSDFANELKGLDEIEQLIIGDFPQSANKEKLVKSMLQYYESKARILELILLEIEKKEKNEIFESEIY